MMILADKLVKLRKKNGWSQEELAERMQVSRQAVSKWESAQSVPDLERILMLGRLFGVTTDYLLKDEIEEEEGAEESGSSAQRVTLAQANDFLARRKSAARRIAIGTLLCVVGVIPLLLLGAATEVPGFGLSENAAAGIGLMTLLVFVAAAVALFISCGAQNAPFAFLEKEPFETEYGVTGMVTERKKAFRDTYVKYNILGACTCVLAPIPLFAGIFTAGSFFRVIMLTVTILLGGIGAALFIVSNVQWAGMQKLLKEGEYAPQKKRKNQIKESVATAYWLVVTAVYLAWSFLTKAWDSSWVVWPVAGVLFAAVMGLCNLLTAKEQ